MENSQNINLELFYPELETPYILQVDSMGVLNYSLQQSGLSLLEVDFRNNTLERVENLVIKISFGFDFIEEYQEADICLDPGEVYETLPKLKIHAPKLFELSEMVKDLMCISVCDHNGVVLAEHESDLPILPMNQWTGSKVFPESLASFVMPNIPDIQNLLPRAAQILKKRFGETSFDGYQSGDKNKVRQQAAAIYAAIYELNILYVSVPPTFFKLGQRVRTPLEVLKMKQGNCVEMSLLYCSLCEAAGLHPFIVVVEGHAFAGVWLVEDVFSSNTSSDISELDNRLKKGIHDIEVVECTMLNAGSEADFEHAVLSARRSMEKERYFDKVIDIYRSHITGILPMPIRVVEDGVVKVYDYGLAEDADLKAVSSQTIEEHFLDTSKKQELSKRDIWMRNLLDLSKNNPLISFRPSQRNIQIFTSDLSSLEDALAQGEEFEIREVIDRWQVSEEKIQLLDLDDRYEAVATISKTEFYAKRLRTFLPPRELERRMKRLYREAKTSVEESGSNTLYLAMGFLRWTDVKDQVDAEGQLPVRYAPLVLVPVDFIRKTGGIYHLVLRDEDPQLNITLLEMLRQNFDLNITGLDPLPQDAHGVDLTAVYNSIRKAIARQRHWSVQEFAFLGHFSFNQFVMWNDLRERFNQLTENKVVRGLVDQSFVDFGEQTVNEENLEEELRTTDIAIASSVDSSQLSAVVEAAKGSSFILYGPPGTGKSQTITNMIANALYQGKTILFVAEKMVALNVVQERLDSMGLGDFYLELHSNKTNKRVVLEKLESNLKISKNDDPELFKHLAQQIQKRKDALNLEVAELHQLRV